LNFNFERIKELRTKRFLHITLLVAVVTVLISFPSSAAITPNSKCPKEGKSQVIKGKTFTCTKISKKLLWIGSPILNSQNTEKLDSKKTVSANTATVVQNKTESAAEKVFVVKAIFMPKPRGQWHSVLEFDGILRIGATYGDEVVTVPGCATIVYDWGVVKNTAEFEVEQGSPFGQLRIDTRNPLTLPRQLVLEKCVKNLEDLKSPFFPNVSFSFQWDISNVGVSVVAKQLENLTDVTKVMNFVPSFPDLPRGRIRWANTESNYASLLKADDSREFTGISVVTYYFEYPFDVCEVGFVDKVGDVIKTSSQIIDRLNGYGSATLNSPIKQLVKFTIRCQKSGEFYGEFEHKGAQDISTIPLSKRPK
jgi:hypothetical protein